MLMRPPNLDQEKRMMDCYYPVLHQCTEEKDFRNAFYNLRVMQKVTQKLDEHDQNIELAIHASHLIFCIMFGFYKTVDVKFVKQFIYCKGPEVVIRITKFFTEVWKIPEREIIIVFLPMLGLSELPDGRAWLKKNYVAVSEYLNFFERNSLKPCLTWNNECHWGHDCKYIDAINTVWLRFHDVMNEIQTEEREKHMAELLEEEAREKDRQTRKREKKKHKKQEKQRKQGDSPELDQSEETEFDPPQSQHKLTGTCLSPENANSNAGQGDTKGNKKVSDSVSLVCKTAPNVENPVEIPSYQIQADFPQQHLADIYYKPEQWTTIQTKRQIQKEKEKKCMKRQVENIQTDIQEKAKKTPHKSPKKKNTRISQNILGQAPAPILVSGNTRWADIAKGVAKKDVRQNVQCSRKKANLYHSQVKVNLGEKDFPSLNVSEEEKQIMMKKNYIKPAKFTFNFHEPVVEPECVTQTENVEGEAELVNSNNYCFGTNISEMEYQDADHGGHCHASEREDEGVKMEAEDDAYDDSLIEKVEAEYCSVFDGNTDDTEIHYQHDANDCSEIDTQPHVEAMVQDNHGVDGYVMEDWSEEIDQIDNACAGVEYHAFTQANLTNSGVEVPVSTPRENSNDMEKEASGKNISYEKEQSIGDKSREYTSGKTHGSVDYVGPENCQVDINAIIHHQTETFPYFEEYILPNRMNNPFFDPSIPLPTDMAFGKDIAPNTVDVLFEDSEEIPSWYNDDDYVDNKQAHEETLTNIQEKVFNIDDKEPVQQFTDGNGPLDPAIIGYKQMPSHQPINPSDKPKRVTQIKISPKKISHDQSSSVAFHSAHETNEQETCYHLSEQEIENIERQTAVIKPLQTNSKGSFPVSGSVPVSNSAFGQKLLENACRLEQELHDDTIGYPEEIVDANSNVARGSNQNCDKPCDGRDDFHFPGFHTGTKLSAHFDNRDVSIFHCLQQVQLEQLARYYSQYKQQIATEASSAHQDSFVYHASCAGMKRKDIEDCLAGNMETLHLKSPPLDPNPNCNKTFKDIRKEPEAKYTRGDDTVTTRIPPNEEYYNYHKQDSCHPQMMAQQVNRQMPQMAAPPILQMGQYIQPPMHPANIRMIQATQAAMAATVMNQIKEIYKSMMKAKMKSLRWREELTQLRNLPPEKQMVVGKIVIPKDARDRIHISHTRYFQEISN